MDSSRCTLCSQVKDSVALDISQKALRSARDALNVATEAEREVKTLRGRGGSLPDREHYTGDWRMYDRDGEGGDGKGQKGEKFDTLKNPYVRDGTISSTRAVPHIF